MEEVILDIPSEYNNRKVLAGFGLRTLSMMLDFVLELTTFALVYGAMPEHLLNPLLLPVLAAIADSFYWTFLESSPLQGTLGKFITGMSVATETGRRITWGDAIGRYFGKLMSWLLCGIGHLAAAWDPEGQALHDKIANTYVIKRS